MSQLRESAVVAGSAQQGGRDLPVLFHRLNTQLGIFLACAAKSFRLFLVENGLEAAQRSER